MFPVLQRTTQVTNQRHRTSLTLICVKMASVMGVTWILGIAANVHALSFLWYPYVVLNSLQGNFKRFDFSLKWKKVLTTFKKSVKKMYLISCSN